MVLPFIAGAVATDVPVCSDMSADILKRGGSGVDAAITGMLCVGVVHAESSGIGGGGFMVIRHTNASVYTINFRETAPSASTVDMYHSNGSLSRLVGNKLSKCNVQTSELFQSKGLVICLSMSQYAIG